jgi:hypothetical protein
VKKNSWASSIEEFRQSPYYFQKAIVKTISHPTRPISGDALCLSNDGSVLVATGGNAILCWQLVWVPEWEDSKNGD